MKNRAKGWLDAAFHFTFREILLHACARYHLSCPIYCLMPDHWHLIWIGQRPESDQLRATAFLREHIGRHFPALSLQDRAYDHVLRERERERDTFTDTCHYIRMNPVRAGLVEHWKDYPYLGAQIAGFPDLKWRSEAFWPTFWKIHNGLSE